MKVRDRVVRARRRREKGNYCFMWDCSTRDMEVGFQSVFSRGYVYRWSECLVV